MDEEVMPWIGNLYEETFRSFVEKKGWKCNHCGSAAFNVEEFANTRLCAVSAVPYVASSPQGQLHEAGIGTPLYTILCKNCFAVTKYDAIKVKSAIDGGGC